jgi:hypothetical protein
MDGIDRREKETLSIGVCKSQMKRLKNKNQDKQVMTMEADHLSLP